MTEYTTHTHIRFDTTKIHDQIHNVLAIHMDLHEPYTSSFTQVTRVIIAALIDHLSEGVVGKLLLLKQDP